MKRTRIDKEMIADYRVLVRAATTAASGKRLRSDVIRFFSDFDSNISRLREDILSGVAPYNRFRRFTIYDPKQRVITAVSFEDRIVHHALMRFAAPVLERAMIPHTYACRPGKGPLAAVKRAQENIRRFPWYVKIDIEKYFESIDHSVLLALLARKFKGSFFHDLVRRIVSGYETTRGKGLPIGSLTSQHFANYYLDYLDRFITERTASRAYVRYMDDMVWWCDDKSTARAVLGEVQNRVHESRRLRVKKNVQIQRSASGMTYCGFRLFPGTIKLTRRKKRRYSLRRAYWEDRYELGLIDACDLQRSYASVRGIVTHASATGWMRRQLERRPGLEV